MAHNLLTGFCKLLKDWLPPRDSNPDMLIQSSLERAENKERRLARQNPEKACKIRTRCAPESSGLDVNVVGYYEGSRYHTSVGTRWMATKRTRGSHRQYKHPSKPGRVTLAGHPNDDLPPGTLNSVLKQAGLKQ
jgi:predicted RNA binding protein YcfA (HicA-like mRNA interferase family)